MRDRQQHRVDFSVSLAGSSLPFLRKMYSRMMRILSYVVTLASSRMGTMALMGSLIFSPSASVPIAKSCNRELRSYSKVGNKIGLRIIFHPLSYLFHTAQLVHCSLVMLHTVLSQLQVSGVLTNTKHTWISVCIHAFKEKTHTYILKRAHTLLSSFWYWGIFFSIWDRSLIVVCWNKSNIRVW